MRSMNATLFSIRTATASILRKWNHVVDLSRSISICLVFVQFSSLLSHMRHTRTHRTQFVRLFTLFECLLRHFRRKAYKIKRNGVWSNSVNKLCVNMKWTALHPRVSSAWNVDLQFTLNQRHMLNSMVNYMLDLDCSRNKEQTSSCAVWCVYWPNKIKTKRMDCSAAFNCRWRERERERKRMSHQQKSEQSETCLR